MDKDYQTMLGAIYENNGRPIYQSENRAPECDECREACHKGRTFIVGPVGVWHVGREYRTAKPRVLFAGQWLDYKGGHNDWLPNSAEECLSHEKGFGFTPVEQTEIGEDLKRFSPFWQFIRQVSSKIFDNDPRAAYKSVAVTNVVKCLRLDKNESPLSNNCLERLQIFQSECATLKPDFVVLMTGWFAVKHVERLLGEYKVPSKKTKTAFSVKRNPSYVWTYHPGYLRRSGNFDVVVEEVARFIEERSKKNSQ